MSDTPPRTLRIFLCYAHEDEDKVSALYQRLQTDGFHLWMDKEDIIPGQEWEPAIRTAVRESAVILVCISQWSVTKTGFVNSEIATALKIAEEQPEGSIFIIPLRLENSPVPERLGRLHWCDYFKRNGYERLMKALHVRAEQLGIVLPEPQPQSQSTLPPQPVAQPVAAERLPKPELVQPSRSTGKSPSADNKPLSFRAWHPFSLFLWIAATAVTVLWLVIVGLSFYTDFRDIVLPTPTKPASTEVAVVVYPTATPTSTPTPIPTPTNPLFPVTLDEWRNEITLRGTELTREGDHYWRYVPGGTYTIGGWTDDEHDNNDEAVGIELDPYWIAKYPVTVQQYRQFIEAGGYDTRAYWTDNGWAWKENIGRTQPWWWDDEQFTSDNQPVVGLRWYEATAFTAWLNIELADSLPDGTCIRLPTEAEWEVACAYGSNGQRNTYPWGEQEPTRDLADFNDGSDPVRSAAVGERPAGTAASGAQDMVGSVWELTTSNYDAFPSASGDVVDDLSVSTYIPIRGGGWWNERIYARCSARNWPPHVGDSYDIGLRCLLSPRCTR